MTDDNRWLALQRRIVACQAEIDRHHGAIANLQERIAYMRNEQLQYCSGCGVYGINWKGRLCDACREANAVPADLRA